MHLIKQVIIKMEANKLASHQILRRVPEVRKSKEIDSDAQIIYTEDLKIQKVI